MSVTGVRETKLGERDVPLLGSVALCEPSAVEGREELTPAEAGGVEDEVASAGVGPRMTGGDVVVFFVYALVTCGVKEEAVV